MKQDITPYSVERQLCISQQLRSKWCIQFKDYISDKKSFHRKYNKKDVFTLKFIQACKLVGMKKEEIKAELDKGNLSLSSVQPPKEPPVKNHVHNPPLNGRKDRLNSYISSKVDKEVNQVIVLYKKIEELEKRLSEMEAKLENAKLIILRPVSQ